MYIKPIIIASLLALSTAGAVTYNFNGKINGISDQSYFPDTGYISPPALAPYGIRFGTPFHGSLTIDLSTLYPDLGFGLPGVLGSSTMSIAGREFVTDYAFLLSSYNEHFVEFWQPMPAGFTTKGLTVYADDVLFTFFGLKGSINDLASFEHASLYWFIYGDGKAGSFSAAFNGRIDRMKVVRGTEQTLVVPVPDAGSTLGLLGFAIAGLGFLKRKLS